MLKPNKNSLFAVLSRSPWWISLLIAAALFFGLRAFLPDVVAAASTVPFVGIAIYAGWIQMQVPSPDHVSEVLERLRGMSWTEFSGLLDAGFRRDGYEVKALDGGAAEFEIRKAGRATVVACKRWKVASTGIGPLKELHAQWKACDAADCMYIAAGDFTANARTFALEKGIKLVADTELTKLVGKI